MIKDRQNARGQIGKGRVFGVGVGPGDPDLVTVRAARILAQVETAVAPATEPDSPSLAMEVARAYLSSSCRVVLAHLPMTNDQEVLDAAWHRTASILAEEALAGREVAFVTLGDCMFYSTWPYIAAILRRLAPVVPLESVPGVTAMSACAAWTGKALSQSKEPLLVWVGAPPEDVTRWCEFVPNFVFMKAGRELLRIAQFAEQTGKSVVGVRRVGQRSCLVTRDLGEWTDTPDYLTTVLVGNAEPFGHHSATPKEGNSL